MKLILVPLLFLAACAHETPIAKPTYSTVPPVEIAADWPSYNNQLSGERFANLAEINSKNVSGLKVVCTYDTKDRVSFQTGLVEVNGALFGTTEQDTFSIDPNTCKENWRTHENVPKTMLNVNRGVAVLDGRVFRGLDVGAVVAYDAKTGKKIWKTVISKIPKVEMIDAAPIAQDGLVYIGNAGGDNKGVKGRMYALDAATGKIVWSFYLVPKQKGDFTWGPEGKGPDTTKTWSNADVKNMPITGGGVWTAFSIDPKTKTVVVPGGNPAPDFVKDVREGENLYAGSIVQLDLKTGDYKKHYPIVLDDFHDYDVSNAPALFNSRAGRDLMAITPKDGHLYLIDRSTDKQVARLPMTTIENERTPLGPKGVRFCPGTQGGAEWNGPAYSPKTNQVYSGQVDWCSTVTLVGKEKLPSMAIHQPWTGSDPKNPSELYGKMDDKSKARGWIVATDADSAQKTWTYQATGPVFAGVTPTAGDIVFGGDMSGDFFALDAATGAKLFSTSLDGAIGGGVITYNTGSGQKVAVAAGMTSKIWPATKTTSRVVILGL